MAPNDIVCLLKTAALAKGDYYHARLFEYRYQHPDNPNDAAIIEFSAAEYAAYQKAKRVVYNAKRRLKTHAAKAE